MIPPEKIRELRELCEKATPGPWEVDSNDEYRVLYPVDNDIGFHKENWKFIAESRTALPLLLDEIERLQAELFKYQEIAQRTIRENKRLRYIEPQQ